MADYSGTGADHTVTVRRLYQALQQMKDKMHPVGSIYMSMDSTSPAKLFGGTWEQISQGRFLLGASGDYEAGETGGEYKHTLTIDEMPSHDHYQQGDDPDVMPLYSSGTYFGYSIPNSGSMSIARTSSKKTSSTGGGQAHNNMPPYLVVYIWERTV